MTFKLNNCREKKRSAPFFLSYVHTMPNPLDKWALFNVQILSSTRNVVEGEMARVK